MRAVWQWPNSLAGERQRGWFQHRFSTVLGIFAQVNWSKIGEVNDDKMVQFFWHSPSLFNEGVFIMTTTFFRTTEWILEVGSEYHTGWLEWIPKWQRMHAWLRCISHEMLRRDA